MQETLENILGRKNKLQFKNIFLTIIFVTKLALVLLFNSSNWTGRQLREVLRDLLIYFRSNRFFFIHTDALNKNEHPTG